MCGIAGFFDTRGKTDSLSSDLPLALDAIRYRGPDDQGIWTEDPGVGLGHRRLSILDLSPYGHQPMVSADGRFVMVFNGEVYNFADIRRDLSALGHGFRGTSDAEVVLAAFAEWGITAVRRFIGMFAIALWDRSRRTLYLLRDRLGVKPLCYGFNEGVLWFGSELKALRAFSHWQPTIAREALSDYFSFGYINAPLTIYRGVYKLPPGHWLEMTPAGEIKIERYWSVLDALSTPLTGSEEDLADQLEALMVDAFRLRMISDVPVGVFLSGGIDSSVVTALLQASHGNISTFTIGFDDSAFNEAGYARQVANHLRTEHTERILLMRDARDIIPMWGSLYDEPFSDQSGIPTYLVSKVASDKVKVVLSADGGDELFSGYNIYQGAIDRAARLFRIPGLVRGGLGFGAQCIPMSALEWLVDRLPMAPGLRGRIHGQVLWRLHRAREYLRIKTPGAFYEVCVSFWNQQAVARLIGSYHATRPTVDDYPGLFPEQMCLWDLHNYLPGDILTKVDRATMAVSIEGREPLLDHRLVEFAFRLPLSLRRGSLGSKHLLRRVLYRHVPRALVERPKMGFAIPLLTWLRGDMSGMLDQYLDPDELRKQGILDGEYVRRTVATFRAGNDRVGQRVWSLLAFQLWHERWG